MSTAISTWTQLAAINSALSGDYILTRDLTTSDADYGTKAYNAANGGIGWIPIGVDAATWFTGRFNGNGHTIAGICINRSVALGHTYFGLFGSVASSAIIENLGVVNVAITVTGIAGTAGGVLGDNNGIVRKCYSTGTIVCETAGGIAGYSQQNAITDCWSSVSVTGDICGGVVGSQGTGGTIVTSYAMGAVTGTSASGGIVASGTATNCYYDASTTGQSDTGKGTGLTHAQSILPANYVGFDFAATWGWSASNNGGYPKQLIFGSVPYSVEYYIVKRGTTIIGYILDPLTYQVSVFEDASQLADGTYVYTLTPMSVYGVAGAAGGSLSLTVSSGAFVFAPPSDPTGLAVVAAAAGTFLVTWQYAISSSLFLPDKFNVYYSLDGTSWTKDGELTYAMYNTFSYNSVNAWANTTVYFKVQPVKGSVEKTNAVSAHAVADTVGPTIATPVMTITEL